MHVAGVDKNRVATYIRWSTDEQSDGTTLEVQRDACRLFTESQGWIFREELVFVDDGYSGGSLERPGLGKLRKAVAAGQVTCVVVYKLDRLSRSVLDTVKLVLEEWAGVCHIRSTREPIDTTSPTGAIFFYMLASYAEWERSTIRERTMSGKIKRAQQGRNPGFTAPYGYTRGETPGQFLIHAEEAAVVRRIFREFISGKGAHAIAGSLNQDRIRPRRAAHWHYSSILDMISNPVYKGVLRYGVTATLSGAQRQQASRARLAFEQPRYACVPDAVPVIIPAEQYDRAQQIRASRQVVGCRARGTEFLLTGIARCRCGAPLRGDGREKTEGNRYYRCSGNYASNPNRCDCSLMMASKLEQAVLQKVREALGPWDREILLGSWREEAEKRLQAVREEARQVENALSQAGRKRARVEADYLAGDLPAKLYAAHAEQLEQEAERLRERLAALGTEAEQVRAAQAGMAGLEDVLKEIDSWEALEPVEQKQLLRFVLARCEVYRRPRGRGRFPDPNPIEVDLSIRRIGI